MRAGARIAAAIEILEAIIVRHQPVGSALADWGKSHRFAGSADRNAIGGLVYDALRRRSEFAWLMNSDTPRALALAAAPSALRLDPNEVIAQCDGESHSPAPMSELERQGLTRPLDDAPDHVKANVPEWLWPSFVEAFGDRAVAEGRHLSQRAPADVRVNTIKSSREKVLKALSGFGAVPTVFSPVGVRIPPPQGVARTPNIEAEAAYQAGWFEIQDEGSQIAALLAGAGPRQQVLDLCAGAGGKTLALGAQMQNTGQIYAYDEDRLRLKPIFERIRRAGVRNVQVLKGGDRTALAALGPRFDLVFVDAPCTGTGVWRRRPDSKWRLKAKNLHDRQAEQLDILRRARVLVKPGGHLVYATCSMIAAENTVTVATFLSESGQFRIAPYQDAWRDRLGGEPPKSADGRSDTLQLTPAQHGTDGFFVAIMVKS